MSEHSPTLEAGTRKTRGGPAILTAVIALITAIGTLLSDLVASADSVERIISDMALS